MICPAPSPDVGDSPDSEYALAMAAGLRPVGVVLVSIGRPSRSRPLTFTLSGNLAKPRRCPPDAKAAAIVSVTAATRTGAGLGQLIGILPRSRLDRSKSVQRSWGPACR